MRADHNLGRQGDSKLYHLPANGEAQACFSLQSIHAKPLGLVMNRDASRAALLALYDSLYCVIESCAMLTEHRISVQDYLT